MENESAFTSFRVRDRRKENKGFYAVLNYRANGTYREKSVALKATNKRDALKEASAVFDSALENEQSFLNDKYKLSTYMNEYLDIREKLADITMNTISSYRYLARKISSELGDPYIHNMSRKDVEAWVLQMQEDGLGADAIAKKYNLLHMVLEHALFHDLILKNPVHGVKKPKRRGREINIVSTEDVKRVLEILSQGSDAQLHALVRIGVFTGMRPAETCALTWSDISDDGQVHIHSTVTRIRGAEYVHKQTKTKAGDRIIFFSDIVMKLLKQLKFKQQEECDNLGFLWNKNLYVLGYADGGFYSPLGASKKFHALVRALGINGSTGAIPRLYDLRHTFATRALQAGVDIETIANSMGHANVAMTLNTYATSDTDAKKRLAQAMNDIF